MTFVHYLVLQFALVVSGQWENRETVIRVNNNPVKQKWVTLRPGSKFNARIINGELTTSWSYRMDNSSGLGQNHWFQKHPFCGFSRQSPVNVPGFGNHDAEMRACEKHKIHLNFINGHRNEVLGNLYNDGVKLYFKPDYVKELSEMLVLQSAFLPYSNFTLDHVIFHWGINNHKGSEHYVDNEQFPFEIQIYYRPIDPPIGKESDRIALSILARYSTIATKGISTIADRLHKVSEPGDKTSLFFDLKPLLPSRFEANQVRIYKGSFPYPGCYEEVTWLVFNPYLLISIKQLETFRGLYDSSPGLKDNFRSLQGLGDREVHNSCFHVLSIPSTSGKSNKTHFESSTAHSIGPFSIRPQLDQSRQNIRTTTASHNRRTPRPRPNPKSRWQNRHGSGTSLRTLFLSVRTLFSFMLLLCYC